MNVRVCPRCQTPVQPGGKVCERCEQPVEGPSYVVRYNPARLPTPSPIQGHATVMIAVIAAVVLLVLGAWYAVQGVGPFRAEVLGQTAEPASGAVTVDLRVSNQGDRKGRARCRITGVGPDGRLRSSEVQLSPVVPGHGSIQFQLRGEQFADAHDVQTSCA